MSWRNEHRPDHRRRLRRRVAVAAVAVTAMQIMSGPVFARAGALDTSLDGDGKLTTTWAAGTSSTANAVVATTVAKIMVAGQAGGQFAVARYHDYGPLHTGWGGTGKVVTALPGGGSANAIALQPDGKVIAVGRAGADFAVVRYNYDGTLDTTFGTGGKVITDLSNQWGSVDEARAVVLQPDGKIVVGGTAAEVEFGLARYLPNGQLDPSFGNAGKINQHMVGRANLRGLAIQADGSIVAVGESGPCCYWETFINPEQLAAARFTSSGALDTSFGDGGILYENPGAVGPPFMAVGTSVAILPGGKVLIGGAVSGPISGDLVVTRRNPDGTPDMTFGTNGITVVEAGENDRRAAMTVQSDGRIVIAGADVAPGGPASDFESARLNPDGSLDTTYGNGGTLRTDFTGGSDQAVAVAIQPTNGRILLAGSTARSYGTDIAILRYHAS